MAATLTVVALPFLWSSKQQSSGAESVAAIGAAGGAAAVAAPVVTEAPPSLADPAYLEAPPTSVGSVPAGDGTVVIDVGPPSGGNAAAGTATYRRFADSVVQVDAPCATSLAPFEARVVVTNTDNGFRLACTNVSTKPLPTGVVILLDTDVFLQLADLGDSPIPVQITW